MDVLLTALGSYGDVFPMIGLGVSLRDRGHRVTVVTNPHFANRVRATGLGYEPIATADEYDRLTSSPDLWNPRRGLDVVFQQGAMGLLPELHATLGRLLDAGADVIGAHGLDLASRLLAESRGARVASVVYAPVALWSDHAPPRMPVGVAAPSAPRWVHRLQRAVGTRLVLNRTVVPPLDVYRAEVGLPPLRSRGGFWAWYYGVAPPVALFPDWFVSPEGKLPPDWPEGTVTSAFALGDGVEDQPLGPELDAWLAGGDAADAPIAFTPGSAMRYGERFFAAAVGCCELLGRRGVLLSKYREHLPSRLPDSVIAPGFVPLDKLLPRCAAFVHHGGVGSCARGLAAGIPQLIQPMAFDQHDNALRLRRLGVADELSPRRFTAQAAADMLAGLMMPRVAGRAKELATRVADGTLDAACDRLEALATIDAAAVSG